MNFFMYARKSTDEDDKQLLSIEAQLEELREHAKREKLIVAEEFIEAMTAKVPGRPVFNAMMKAIEKGQAEGILSWHPDRLARNSVDGGRIVYLLDTGKLTTLKFPSFWFENTPQGKFMLSIAFGQSKYYVDNLSENVKRGIRQKLRLGWFPGRPPIGYLNEPRLRTIVIDDEKAPLVRRLFETYATGGVSYQAIVEMADRMGLITVRDHRFRKSWMHGLLSNPFYTGVFRLKGETYEGAHEPLISRDLFDRVQAVLNKRSRARTKSRSDDPCFFVGLMQCDECESGITRYLAGFWPFFDFAGLIVPAEGKAALITGGPESFEYAKKFARAPQIRINPLLVETSAPEWVPKVHGESFKTLLPEVCGRIPQRIGLANGNIFPKVLFDDLRAAAPKAELVPADDLLLRVQMIKTDAEIPYLLEAYRITEEAMKAALRAAKPGKREWELEAVARSKMVLGGAEGMAYPAWVCSGPTTPLSLCRSTERPIRAGELVQFTFGAKYMGYCGNMCRPFAIGSMPKPARRLADAALEAMRHALDNIRPGVRGCDIFDGYHRILAKYGYENFALYGPAHGTGSSEVEGLWLSKSAGFVIQPNMVFNVDIWLSDGKYGLRYEDGVLVTKAGLRELSGYRREVIEL